MITPRRFSLLVAQGVMLMSLTGGCGGSSLTKDEIDKARKAVDVFLTSWKQGDTPDKLKGQAIIVEDPDWTAGLKLLDFQIIGTEGDNPPNPRFTVKLTLKGEEGPSSEANVVYEINAKKEPGKTFIARDPFF